MNMHINDLQNQQNPKTTGSVVLWVPAEAIVIHQISQPKAPKRKWPELVAWQLEDRLLQRVEEMHFVIIGQNADDTLDVAAVSKQTIRDWISLADNAHIENYSLIPDYLALPWEEGSITVSQRDDLLLVRNGKSSGFAASPTITWSLLESFIENSPEETALSVFLPDEMVPVALRTNAEFNSSELDWQHAKASPSANLLTGEFKQKKSSPFSNKRWAFAALLLICLSLGFGYTFFTGQDTIEERSNQLRAPLSTSSPARQNRDNSQQAETPVVEQPAPRMQVNAEVVGIVITPTSSYASIKVNGQPEKVFHIDDEIKRGQKVSEITPQGVTIEGRGQFVDIFLSKYEDLISLEGQKNSTSINNNQDGFALANMFAAVPVQVENYTSALKLDSLSDEMKMLTDIREGDVVVQVGNNNIQEMMSDPTLWANYSTNTALTVTVIRDGEEVALIVNASSLSAKILPSLASELIP